MLEDPISGNQLLIVPNQIRDRYKEHVTLQKRLIKSIFLKSNCGFIELITNKPFIGEVIKFFKEREKRL